MNLTRAPSLRNPTEPRPIGRTVLEERLDERDVSVARGVVQRETLLGVGDVDARPRLEQHLRRRQVVVVTRRAQRRHACSTNTKDSNGLDLMEMRCRKPGHGDDSGAAEELQIDRKQPKRICVVWKGLARV